MPCAAQFAGDRHAEAECASPAAAASRDPTARPASASAGSSREAVVAEALHAPAFVIDADQQRRRRSARIDAVSARELLRRLVSCARTGSRPPPADAARRARSAAVSARPSTPSITGPRAEAARLVAHRPHGSDLVARRLSGRLAHQRLHLAHGLAQSDEHARATIAWPMCSSRTPGSAATGWTLK